ncbi:MAG: class I SAM-dependent methyltransferase [Thermoanaerobaculia bacterium]
MLRSRQVQIFRRQLSYLWVVKDSNRQLGCRGAQRRTRRSLRACTLATILMIAACGSGRVSAGETDRIAEVLALESGKVVADVGAGDGDWTFRLAERVGAAGHVYATEVDEDELDKIRRRIRKGDHDNVTAVKGDQDRTSLEADCCDAILLRLVYHHFTQPAVMRADLRRALRSGGLLAIIDIVPQKHWRELPEVPDRGGHGIPVVDVIQEMTDDGFEVVAQYDDWNGDDDRFCVVFRLP